jgi:hypothetical protein
MEETEDYAVAIMFQRYIDVRRQRRIQPNYFSSLFSGLLSSFFLLPEYTPQVYIQQPPTAFEDVKIVCPKEIITNLPEKKYLETDKKFNECIICLEDFNDEDIVKELPCIHVYHINCINKWLSQNSNKCPVCKKEVSNGVPLI